MLGRVQAMIGEERYDIPKGPKVTWGRASKEDAKLRKAGARSAAIGVGAIVAKVSGRGQKKVGLEQVKETGMWMMVKEGEEHSSRPVSTL